MRSSAAISLTFGSALLLGAATNVAAQNALPKVEYPFEPRSIPVGGTPTAPAIPEGDGFLWIVSLGFAGMNHALGGHFCGGSIIAPRWILTAAHCVMARSNTDQAKMDAKKIQVKLGHELDKPGSIFHVEKIVVHPNYQVTAFNTLLNDVALLKLTSDVKPPVRVEMVRPVDAEFLRDNLVVIGWGKPGARKNYLSNRLRYLLLNRVPLDQCNSNYYPGLLDDKVICALGNGTDACQGDSGGPLVGLDDASQYHLFGVVSWGDQCGETLKPGIYVQVPSYYGWIQKEMSAN